MLIRVVRKWGGAGYCASDVYIDDKLFCQAIEDCERTYNGKPLEKGMGAAIIKQVKVPKETAIPRGRYAVALTPSAHFAGKEPYRSVSGGIVPAVVGVPGYEGIRIHCGVHAGHSEGCLLLGQNPNDQNHGKNSNSRETWIAFWNIVKGQSGIEILYTCPEGAAGLSGESMEGLIGAGGGVPVVSYRLSECPPNIKFKKLWNMYREKTKTITYADCGDGVMGNFDFSNIDMSNIDLTNIGVDAWTLQFIAKCEAGIPFPGKLPNWALNGKDIGDANGHKTYGWGSLYHPNGKLMDTIKTTWTQAELEQCFLGEVAQKAAIVRNWEKKNNIQLNEAQRGMCVSCCYNFGQGWLNKQVARMIAANPNDPAIYSVWANTGSGQFAKYPGLKTRRLAEANHYFGRG